MSHVHFNRCRQLPHGMLTDKIFKRSRSWLRQNCNALDTWHTFSKANCRTTALLHTLRTLPVVWFSIIHNIISPVLTNGTPNAHTLCCFFHINNLARYGHERKSCENEFSSALFIRRVVSNTSKVSFLGFHFCIMTSFVISTLENLYRQDPCSTSHS